MGGGGGNIQARPFVDQKRLLSVPDVSVKDLPPTFQIQTYPFLPTGLSAGPFCAVQGGASGHKV